MGNLSEEAIMNKKIKHLLVLVAMVVASLFFGQFLKSENVSLAQGGGCFEDA